MRGLGVRRHSRISSKSLLSLLIWEGLVLRAQIGYIQKRQHLAPAVSLMISTISCAGIDMDRSRSVI